MTDETSAIIRKNWHLRIEAALKERSIVWLMGVRRVGKSVLCKTLPNVEYIDCELPRVRRQLEDPEAFLARHRNQRLVLDEIHRLPDPSELLKIAADHYPDVRIVATGSSTLSASAKFRDTLTGRKRELWLSPMTLEDAKNFGTGDVRHRALRGGLPPMFLARSLPERDYQEWFDSYFAKDVLELFKLERRASFQQLFELLLIRSGGMLDATKLSKECSASRQTITNYVSVLEKTFVVHLIRPFAGGGATEIVSAPKAFGFDTGFVCAYRGWNTLRSDDMGVLLEHLVLNEMHSRIDRERIHYWRTKQGQEIDFVVATARGKEPIAVECKSKADSFDVSAILAFRKLYPGTRNYAVCLDVDRIYTRDFRGTPITFVPPSMLGDLLDPPAKSRPRKAIRRFGLRRRARG